jgi:RNA methyltransferase, TrmH family
MPTVSIRARSGRPAPRPAPRIVQSRQNAFVKELRSGFARSTPTDEGHIAIECEHMVREAIASGLVFSTVFVRIGSEALVHDLNLPETVEILVLPPDVFESAVHTDSPQGIAALVEPPVFTLDQVLAADSAALVVVSAGLQDPGNLGTLIRSAEAFGATGLVLLPGTVSLYNQKALRASSGSAFRLPCVGAKPDELFAALSARKIAPLAAVASDGEPLTQHDLAQPCALILGNEGNGIPEKILNMVATRVTIPTPGPVESLNAAIAGSILLYEAARQRGLR